MLFEKIQFMVDNQYKKRDRTIQGKKTKKSQPNPAQPAKSGNNSRGTLIDMDQHKEFKDMKLYYMPIINLIRKTYANLNNEEHKQ